jgi:hypothetical protein
MSVAKIGFIMGRGCVATGEGILGTKLGDALLVNHQNGAIAATRYVQRTRHDHSQARAGQMIVY